MNIQNSTEDTTHTTGAHHAASVTSCAQYTCRNTAVLGILHHPPVCSSSLGSQSRSSIAPPPSQGGATHGQDACLCHCLARRVYPASCLPLLQHAVYSCLVLHISVVKLFLETEVQEVSVAGGVKGGLAGGS
jgi:hypothetical protein